MIIKSDTDTIKSYFEDSSNLKGGHADKVVIPENVAELASFMKEASSRKNHITVSGGGTGTTGSRIPFGGVLISMEKFSRILEISDAKMSATVQAGVLVEELKNAVERRGLFYTSHPTEKTAAVGGTVATNASGSRSFRYGPTRRHVKALKMVLPDGEIFELTRGKFFLTRAGSVVKFPSGRKVSIPLPTYRMPEVKSSAGYFAKDGMDLIDLFIGQEGTLSIITEIEMGLVKRPSSVLSCFVFFGKESDAWSFSEKLKGSSGPDILSIEYFDSNAVKLLKEKNGNVPEGMDAAIFFEQDTSGGDIDEAAAAWARVIPEYGTSLEATWIAMSEKEAGLFTQLRHSIPESINEIIRRSGFRKFSTDIAVPGAKLSEMIAFYVSAFRKERLEHVIFGHIGENHLHVNILPKSEDEAMLAEKHSLLFVKKGVSLGGTVSAEHGIGKLKHGYLEEMYGRRGIVEMINIKKVLDPKCILGLDNIFPRENLI